MAEKSSLSTEDLQEIFDYLSNLKTNYGYVPEYLARMHGPLGEVSQLTSDSSLWGDPAGWDMNTGEYGYIPANQLEGIIPSTETEFEDWLLNFRENSPASVGHVMHDIFGQDNESFRPHEREMEIMKPYLPYLASKEGGYNTELRPGGKFFPRKGYPELRLDALQQLIDSREEVDLVSELSKSSNLGGDTAGIYWGEDLGTGMFDIDIDKEYSGHLPSLAQILGHETGHLSNELHPYTFEKAPYPFSHMRRGSNMYNKLKDMGHEGIMGSGTTHWAPGALHAERHSIDRQFFGGEGQPEVNWKLSRVTPINKAQVENVNYMMNRTVEDERRDATPGPWNNFGPHLNAGGIVSLML